MSIEHWLSLPVCFIVTALAIKHFRHRARTWGLVDHPNERKLHTDKTPLVGGLAIFLGLLFAFGVWAPEQATFRFFILAASLVVAVGIVDDRYDISIRMRLLGQVLAATLIVISGDARIDSVGNLLGNGEILLGPLAGGFTVFAVVGVMNAFNMVDGIDGLLGSLVLVAVAAFAVLCLSVGNSILFFVSAIIFAALIPYLYANMKPEGHSCKVFMGDAGSMLLGFTISWLFIMGSQPAGPLPQVMEPITALFFVAVPFWDLQTVVARRLKQRRNPFRADRQHIHHLYEKAGYSKRVTLTSLLIIGSLIAGVGIFMQLLSVSEPTRLLVFAAIGGGFVYLTKFLKDKMTKQTKLQQG